MRRVVVVVVLLGAAVLFAQLGSGALGAPARLDGRVASGNTCSQVDVTGTWTTLQSNRYSVTWKFAQTGTRISGSAVLPQADADRAGYTGTVGQLIKGSLVGDRLDVVVQWPARTDGSVARGEYVGTVVGGRVSDGQAWDLANPSAKASWTGNGPAKCASGAAPSKATALAAAQQLVKPDEQAAQQLQRWQILESTQTKIFQIQQDVTVQKARTADKAFSTWQHYISHTFFRAAQVAPEPTIAKGKTLCRAGRCAITMTPTSYGVSLVARSQTFDILVTVKSVFPGYHVSLTVKRAWHIGG